MGQNQEATLDFVDRVDPPYPLYEMLAMVRIMNDFGHLDVPAGSETTVKDRNQSDVRAVLDQ